MTTEAAVYDALKYRIEVTSTVRADTTTVQGACTAQMAPLLNMQTAPKSGVKMVVCIVKTARRWCVKTGAASGFLMANIPIFNGTASFTAGSTPYGFYDNDNIFVSESVDFTIWCARIS